MIVKDNRYKKAIPKNRDGPLIVFKSLSYFLALVSIFGLDVSVIILFALVSGETVVVSELDFDSPLLLQAAKDAVIIAIAKNFFIFKFLGLLTIDLGFIPGWGKR
jgi:hypothetical protein